MTDKIGARIVVNVGMLVAMLGTLAFTRVGADTSYRYFAVALFVVGLGIGSTIMPSMAAAFQTLSRPETPRGTSALTVVQRVGGAIGTALLAINLQRAIAANVPDFQAGSRAWPLLLGSRARRRCSPTPSLARSGSRSVSSPSRWCRLSCSRVGARRRSARSQRHRGVSARARRLDRASRAKVRPGSDPSNEGLQRWLELA
ncbi:MAG: multidrug efflux MFS transporter [Actinobacteria bacterium]|nr:MAG: multidrug efflux MFS transporter [Actinomycetota bacterium]